MQFLFKQAPFCTSTDEDEKLGFLEKKCFSSNLNRICLRLNGS